MCFEEPSQLENTKCQEHFTLCSQNDKSVLKEQKNISLDSSSIESGLARQESDVLITSDQSENTSENKTGSQTEECLSTSTKTDISDSEQAKHESECAILHTDPGSETFPHDSETSQTSSFR